jgi:hypothetical protein
MNKADPNLPFWVKELQKELRQIKETRKTKNAKERL